MKPAQQFVRDLLWAVNSPSLVITPNDFGCDSKVWRLQEQDIRATHLVDFMERKDARSLGKYFEGLISYWLHHVRNVEVLFESFPIQEQSRTIGEIDFIFIDEQARVTHWEVAVKFYLFSPNSHGLGSHYLGPNAVDTLDRKIDYVFGHQLPRSKKLFPGVERRHALMKGRIFYPFTHKRGLNEHPYLSSAHLEGLWIRHVEIGLLVGDAGWDSRSVCYLILKKPNWLSVIEVPRATDHLMSFREFTDSLEQHFAERQRCLLVVQLKVRDVGCFELRRFFVVPDCWPC